MEYEPLESMEVQDHATGSDSKEPDVAKEMTIPSARQPLKDSNCENSIRRERLASRFDGLGPSCTLELKATARNRIARNLPVYDFGLGENSFPLPDGLLESAVKCIRSGNTGYADPSGIAELRDKILEWMNLEDQYQRHNVIVSCGAKQAILNVFLAVCNPGDVILTAVAPWVSYGPIAQCASATAIQVTPNSSNSLKVSRKELLEAFTKHPKTRVFLLNNPCNPTGQLYSEQEVNELLELCVDHNVYFMLDRLYWKIVFDGKKYPEPEINEHTKPWLIQIEGLSKNFCKLGGLRVGWSIAPSDVSELMTILQSHHSSGTAVSSQEIALEVLSREYNSDLLTALQRNRDLLKKCADSIQHLKVCNTQGAYYSFWDVRATFGKKTSSGAVIKDSQDLAEYLVNEYGVVTAPGKSFGLDGYLRLSFAIAVETIEPGMAAAKQAFANLVE